MSNSHSRIARFGAGFIRTSVLAGLVLGAMPAVPAFAQDYWSMSCRQLWYERNAYYKARGYCFKTREAIQAFGNEGCYVDVESQIRFTPPERRQIDMIRAAERDRGCN